MPGPKCNGKWSRNAQFAAARLSLVKNGSLSDGVSDTKKKARTIVSTWSLPEETLKQWALPIVWAKEKKTRASCTCFNSLDCCVKLCVQSACSVSILPDQNACFASKFRLCCDARGYEKQEMSSPRVQGSDKKNVAFEINPKMVLFSHEMGGRHGVLQKFGTAHGMPAMHLDL